MGRPEIPIPANTLLQKTPRGAPALRQANDGANRFDFELGTQLPACEPEACRVTRTENDGSTTSNL